MRGRGRPPLGPPQAPRPIAMRRKCGAAAGSTFARANLSPHRRRRPLPRSNNEGERPLTVTNLFIKRKHGAALEEVSTFCFDKDGIGAGVACAPFRQVLIASRPILADCGLKPGDLRENVLLEDDGLYDLPSGTVVRLGQALIRLTFHCEPCKKILKLIAFDRIVTARRIRMFSQCRNNFAWRQARRDGPKIRVDPLCGQRAVRWFLSKGNAPAAAGQLIEAIGLPSSYARAMPRLLEKFLSVARA